MKKDSTDNNGKANSTRDGRIILPGKCQPELKTAHPSENELRGFQKGRLHQKDRKSIR